MYIDRSGTVGHAEIRRSSGHVELDRAALRSVARMRFEPARNLGRVVEVWVSQWVNFPPD